MFRHSMNDPRISIVIPAKDEAESLADLVREIASVLAHESYEVIVVDDGSTDRTTEIQSSYRNSTKRCVTWFMTKAAVRALPSLRGCVRRTRPSWPLWTVMDRTIRAICRRCSPLLRRQTLDWPPGNV